MSADDPGRHGRFAAVDGWVYTRPCRTENQDVLFRVPRTSYFRTRYKEMSIPMALSSEIFIDDILKKSLIFKVKRLDLIGRWFLLSRKNHKMIDGKLLQTDKKYSHLKLKQKEKIAEWMYLETKTYYEKYYTFPGDKQIGDVISKVYNRITDADIWIPYGEVAKHYKKKRTDINKRVRHSLNQYEEKNGDSLLHEPMHGAGWKRNLRLG